MSSSFLPDENHLPIDALLPALQQHLASQALLVLSAPPGAGKTTRIPLALLATPWLAGKQIIMLEPRRLAAKAAARRMAASLSEPCGQRVGYCMRMEHCFSPQTRILVVTEGVLTRMLHDDPELANVGCLIFDEFHERSLHADVGLALALECHHALRPDLRLLVMSATLETEAVAALLGNCPVLTSQGRAYPVALRYMPPRPNARGFMPRIEEQVAAAILLLLREEDGSLLAFLPGAGEIRAVQALLEEQLPPDVQLYPLYGDLPPAQQDAAIAPAAPQQRKVVLATALAETSLTIEGVRLVVDSGLARSLRYDSSTGMSTLVTQPLSLAQAAQRAGRAGRTAAGLCLRLWKREEEINFRPHSAPEISMADLSPLCLNLAVWGAQPESLAWLTPPPASAFAHARSSLQTLHALDAQGRSTAMGRAMLRLPLHPRLACMVLQASILGFTACACCLAALLEERDCLPAAAGHTSSDISLRLHAVCTNRPHTALLARIRRAAEQLFRLCGGQGALFEQALQQEEQCGLLLSLAWPERLAQQCGGGRFRLRGGRAASLPQTDPLAREAFLAIATLDAVRERIFLAAPISKPTLEQHYASEICQQELVYWDVREEAVLARQQHQLGALLLHDAPLSTAEPQALAQALCAGIRHMGIACLPWTNTLRQWQARVLLLRQLQPELWPDVCDATLEAQLEEWLAPFLTQCTRKSHLKQCDLKAALHSLLSYQQRRDLEKLAPERLVVPSGSSISIDYCQQGHPVLAAKLQELFGWEESPRIAGGAVPLTLHLNSPAGRPLQITQDLGHFWRNGYVQVRADMRGRYPKHPWPENPLQAQATTLTKKKLEALHK